MATTVRELDDLGGQDKVPAQLSQVDRQGGETAAALAGLTLRLAHGPLSPSLRYGFQSQLGLVYIYPLPTQ